MAGLSGERAFYYVDGIPTKGLWVDLEDADEESILEALADGGFIPRERDEDLDDPDNELEPDGDPVYGGDLLVACTEGTLAPHFLSKYDCFDLDGFTEVADFLNSRSGRCYSEDAVAAYLDYAGKWSQRDFEQAYQGAADSETEFAEQLLDDTGDIDSIPEWARMYFDYESYGRDLFINDYYLNDGHVFRRN